MIRRCAVKKWIVGVSAAIVGLVLSTVVVYFVLPQDASHPPLATSDSYMGVAHQALDQPEPGVLANDEDPDGDSLKAVVIDAPLHGTLSLDEDGSFSYRPMVNFTGTDRFTYQASDGKLESEAVVVRITMARVSANDIEPPKRASGGEGMGKTWVHFLVGYDYVGDQGTDTYMVAYALQDNGDEVPGVTCERHPLREGQHTTCNLVLERSWEGGYYAGRTIRLCMETAEGREFYCEEFLWLMDWRPPSNLDRDYYNGGLLGLPLLP